MMLYLYRQLVKCTNNEEAIFERDEQGYFR